MLASTWSRRAALAALALAAACRETPAPGLPDDDAGIVGPADAAPGPADADLTRPDAADLPDGPPVRRTCTNNFGQELSSLHGRLDGILVAVVPPGFHGCNGDSDHVHLQVEMHGSTYDVAVNVSDPLDVDFLARDLQLPGGAWAEGWHTGSAGALDYPALGLHAADFTPMPRDALAAQVAAELAEANHVSVFMTGYGPDGGHDVHRRFSGADGAIVIRPLSATARTLFFHFPNQSF